MSAYLLSEPSPSFAPLLKPLLTPQSVPETLVVILLDWSDPWTWVRRLREWVRLLRQVLISVDDKTKIAMAETMTEWRDRKRGMDSNSAGAQGLASSGGAPTIPLGSGEWDEALGIPMCVVCQGVCMTAANGEKGLCADWSCPDIRPITLKNWRKTMVGTKRSLTLSSSS